MNLTPVENVEIDYLRGNLFRVGWELGAFSDVELSAFGQNYATHRIILSLSPYFETLLQGDWSDSQSKKLTLIFDDPHIQPDTFRRALEFLYGGKIDLTEETVHGTLATGCFLGLEALSEKCFEFISENLTLESFQKLYLFCSRFDYGVYSKRIKKLCLDFLRMHVCWEAREVLNDLEWKDMQELLMDDGLWVPTEVERFLMLQDALPNTTPMTPRPSRWSEDDGDGVYLTILKSIRFEHFPETTLNLLKEETGQMQIVQDAIHKGIETQIELQKKLNFPLNKIGSKLGRHFRVFSKSDLVAKPSEIIHRSFRVGIEFMEISNVFKTKGLDSREYFYAGSLWRVHMVQRRVQIDGVEYIGVFIHRRCANGMRWVDHRECVEADLRVRMGWGENKVDKSCLGRFNPDSWHSYGWPQFIKKLNFEKCRQSDGSLRVTLNITLQL
eukprot:g7324.t1